MGKGDNSETTENSVYRVLARKYRPQTFEDLVGQEAMVRILSAAFETGRIAHAYMLTGVRGVGKTTTARLIARALNYTDEKGNSTPSIHFDKPGAHCEAIQKSQHMDILEMDAASRTGIDDIREIIDGARFKPASAPYKVYIIDEVHMLSKAAFNGLLKILEEPPEHVKFIFATTEVRKVPVTVLSRCQRFDLRRIEPDMMIAHLGNVAEQENVEIDQGALALLARGSEGSVRDALSLLDQAIAHGAADKAAISETSVRDMMGLADRERVLDLFDQLMQGDIKGALEELKSQYDMGADPLEVMRDLLDVTHWLTRVQATGEAGQESGLSDSQIKRGTDIANKLSMSALSRTWQILLKGLKEAQAAPRPLAAVEMVLVRLAYSTNLPAPDELIRKITKEGVSTQQPTMNAPAPNGGPTNAAPAQSQTSHPRQALSSPQSSGTPQATMMQSSPEPEHTIHTVHIGTFEELLQLIDDHRNIRLRTDVDDYVHLVSYEMGRLEFRPASGAPDDLASRLSQHLQDWTGSRWIVTLSNEPGDDTISSVRKRERAEQEAKLREHPLVKAAFDTFPNAKILDIRDRQMPEFDAEDALGVDPDDEDIDF